jgi:hypothetical protein
MAGLTLGGGYGPLIGRFGLEASTSSSGKWRLQSRPAAPFSPTSARDRFAHTQRGEGLWIAPRHVLVDSLAAFVDRSDELEEQRHQQWALATRQALDAMALPAGYPNLLADGDTDRAANSYGLSTERLIKAKRRYGPDSVFRSAIPLLVADSRGLERRAARRWHAFFRKTLKKIDSGIHGGGGGIRTRETIHHRLHALQACAFNRSATPPGCGRD